MKEDKDYQRLYRDMMEFSQEEIKGSPEEEEAIEIPENIDEYILKGVDRGRKALIRKRLKLTSTIAAAFACIFFVSMIYISPAFARSVSNIPGLSYLVELVYGDKGLEAAVEKDFVIRVNETVEHQNIAITITDVIMDITKAEVFYKIVNESEVYNNIFIGDLEFFDQSGKQLNLSYGVTTKSLDFDEAGGDIRNLSIYFSKDMSEIPKTLTIIIKVRNQQIDGEGIEGDRVVLEDNWRFSFDTDRDKLLEMVEEIEINETTEIEGQKIIFKRARITPTILSLDIEYPESNSKKILRYEDIEIVNEKGEAWGRPEGLTGLGGENNEITLYFQSSYFSDSKELYVRGSAVRALDKDKLEVVFDLDKEEVVKAPDRKLHFQVAERSEESTTISFSYEDRLPKLYDKDGEEINILSQIFDHHVTDGSGETLRVASMLNNGDEPNEEGLRSGAITIATDKELQGTIILRINDYPARIQEEFKVRIK